MITEFDIKVEKMRKYCLFADRCHRDVRTKLIKDKIYGDELEQIMAVLIEENFLNEERFAKAFVKGKFKQNKWGKKRIMMELKQRGISPYCIRKGFEEISDEEYWEMARKLYEKKFDLVRETDLYKKRQKVLNYMISKGYEYEVVKEFMG
ncbi:regulatory protein RecX [Portibacter lacus]|uniref:Regulatory protein RecX n=1 Tax=Portibacter lacus TaxID=1099794 RepID=A0AA37SS42_9BACT|nr:regulatory protein RecX [Portibacter lacus]GLR18594.1 recombinase RecX [Portibacter lacus]